MTADQIAAETGYSRSGVYYVLSKGGYYTQAVKDRQTVNRKKFNDKVSAIKLEAGCADCGYRCDAVALDFDHLPGTTKLFTIANSPTRAWHEILLEIAKCDVVCANCHRIRTHRGRSVTPCQGSDRSPVSAGWSRRPNL